MHHAFIDKVADQGRMMVFSWISYHLAEKWYPDIRVKLGIVHCARSKARQ